MMHRLLPALLLLFAGCTQVDEGLFLGIEFELTSPTPAPLEWTASDGSHVRVETALLVLNSVEIFPCPSPLREAWRRLWPISTAHAHTPGTPTRLGIPLVARWPDASGPLGPIGLNPPLGRYCRARLAFGPADEDSLHHTGRPDALGKTLVIEGTYAPSGQAERLPFRIESTAFRLHDLALPPLSLDEDNPKATWRFEAPLGAWTSTLDPAMPQGSDALWDALLSSVTPI